MAYTAELNSSFLEFITKNKFVNGKMSCCKEVINWDFRFKLLSSYVFDM